MPTNDERREVARKLREIVPERFNSILYGIHLSNVGIGPCAQIVSAHSCIIRDVACRLADLIEPEPERTCKMVEKQWDNGMSVWDCQCTSCGEKFEYENGHTWRFCPECGARIV